MVLGVLALADVAGASVPVSGYFAAALATKTTEVILWGPEFPADLERGGRQITYRLSRAALVFKGHALAAAGLDPGSIALTETFGTTCARSVIAPDLDVAG